MDCRAAHEQREDAWFRVLMMLVALVVLTVRAGPDAKGTPQPKARRALFGSELPLYEAPLSGSHDRTHRAVELLLSAVDAAAQHLIAMMRSGRAFLQRSSTRPMRQHGCRVVCQCGQTAGRLDSS